MGVCRLKTMWPAVCVSGPGDMITEEALPTYMAMLNTLDGVRDETGASPTPWAAWTRLWTAEENRHGDLMSKYIYLTGRSVETCRKLCSQGVSVCRSKCIQAVCWGHAVLLANDR